MGDRYGALVNSRPGRSFATMLGLPRPVHLRRYAVGQPLLVGPALVRGVGEAPLVSGIVRILTSAGAPVMTTDAASSRPASGGDSGSLLGAVVIDVSAARVVEDLESLRAVLAPSLRRLGACARIVLIGTPPESLPSPAAAATQRALEGIVRSVAKELRDGATANLIYLGDGRVAGDAVTGEGSAEATAIAAAAAATLEPALESPLRFLLSARSAYVDGQVIQVSSAEVVPPADWSQPLLGQVVVVTGAARGIGAAIVEVFARDGAHVICLDVPAAGDSLAAVANRIGGTALQVDITALDAGHKVAKHLAQRHGGTLDVLVHNAGITRDRLLANTDADRWGSVLGVNLAAQLRINEVLLNQAGQSRSGNQGLPAGGVSGLVDGGRIVTVSSTSGIAGNRGQASYAASKAGLIGMVQSLSAAVADRGITVNAVAPGFIETEMTARIPLATREVGRRINSLSQGGRPVDVGETIAWLAQSASAGVTGQVIRVCGQSLLGA